MVTPAEARPAREDGFSYIRAISCIAIIVLHTVFSAILMFQDSLTPAQSTASHAVANCMMWAVPCFVMVTGALLLNPAKELSYRKLFGKYVFRIFVLLVAFCMVFRVFDIFMNHEAISAGAFLQGFYQMFTATSWSHLWYLYLLIGLYLLLPFYRMVAKHSGAFDLKYLLVIYIVFLSLVPLLQNWVNCGFYVHVSTIYPFYLFCGFVIHRKNPRMRIATAWLLLAVGTAAIVLLTILRWETGWKQLEALWGYSSILVIAQSAGFFALVSRCKGKAVVRKILLQIDRCSLGIYLIHMIFVRLFLRYWGFNPYTGGVLAFVGLILLIFVISFAITWLLKWIPGVRRIL